MYPEVLWGCGLWRAFGGSSGLLLCLCGFGPGGIAIGGSDPSVGELDLALYGHWCFPGVCEPLAAAGYGEDHC